MSARLMAPIVGAALVAGCGGGGGGGGGAGGGGPTPPPPPPANRAPSAVIAASPMTVPRKDNHQTVVTLDGSGSTDPDGDALTFSWAVTSGTFVNGTSPTDATVQVTFPGLAPYPVTLDVSDGKGGTARATTTINLGP
ncbi:MAG: PKD domain-containing protein [Gemmatimonadota bacterium]